MSEGWSERRDLIPSNGPSMHPDPRTRWSIGDLTPCNVTHRNFTKPAPLALSAFAGKCALHSQDYLITPPRELTDRQLLAAARRIARERLLDQIERAIDNAIAELRGAR